MSSSIEMSNSPKIDAASDPTGLATMVFWERIRVACAGTVRSSTQILIHVVAVQHFGARNIDKGWLVATFALGFLLTPFSTWFIGRVGLRVTWANGFLFAASALGLVTAAFASGFEGYFWALVLGLPLLSMTVPNTTALWRQTAPDHLRGRLFGNVSRVGVLAGLVGGAMVAGWIGDEPERFRAVLLFLAILLVGASYVSFRTPSQPLDRGCRFPLAPLAFLVRDRLFGYVALTWMVMGFANLVLLPLRVEFLGNEAFGFGYPAWLVVGLLTVVPESARLLTIPMWGLAFDRMNFLSMRILVNACFGLSPFLFFTPWMPCQVLGAFLFGMGLGGAQIAWNLWVTKFAPPERTADYMSVHAFLTGTRGLLGSMLALNLLGVLPIQSMAWTAGGIMFFSCLMLLPILHHGSSRRRMQPAPAPRQQDGDESQALAPVESQALTRQ
jgi:MFS family permease